MSMNAFAQRPFVVTCPTRERAEMAMLSGTPIRAGSRAFTRVSGSSQQQPQGKSLLSLRLAALTAT